MPQPTEAQIRARFAPSIFDRGLAYYNNRHVLTVTRGGNTLSGKVQGSQPTPYAVVVQLGDEGQPQFWSCSCAAADGGDACKHVVALLLTAAHIAEIMPDPRDAQAAQALLAEVGDEQLRQAMAYLLRTQPAFADAFVRSVVRQRSPGTAEPVSPVLFQAMVESVQRELRHRFAELHDLGDRLSADEPDYDDYGYYENQPEPPSFPADILANQIESVETLLGANEADLALDLLSVVLEEWGIGVQDLPEVVTETFPDDLAEITSTLVHLLAGALLWPEASAEARADCAEAIDMWLEQFPELELAAKAVAFGWDHPPLVAVLRGMPSREPIWGNVPDWVEASLTVLYLSQLDRQEREEEYLHLAKAAERGDLYVYRLAQLGRTEQAVAEAPQMLHLPGQFMQLGRILLAQGAPKQGLHTAALGLPDWCIRQCQRQAEAVIQRGSSGHYADALPWLRRAQAIYREQGRPDEWQTYITRLIEANRRKYTLTPLLRELG